MRRRSRHTRARTSPRTRFRRSSSSVTTCRRPWSARCFGARVVRAPELLHGKTSQIYHRGEGVLDGLPIPFEATRYHSLIVERASLPHDLKVTAETHDEIVMAVRHREYPIEGVQFHPESVLTTEGMRLLRNFLKRTAEPARA